MWQVSSDIVSVEAVNPEPEHRNTVNASRVEDDVAINDFVVKFANVNGSGSASANELFAKAILRMGVPVSPRNIFPSNIQGLPTRRRGFAGRDESTDLDE